MTEQILFACVEQCCYFKLSGELRYTNASGMDDLIERLFSAEIQCNSAGGGFKRSQFYGQHLYWFAGQFGALLSAAGLTKTHLVLQLYQLR